MQTWKRVVPLAHAGLGVLYAVTLLLAALSLHTDLLPYEMVAEPALPPRARLAWRAVAVSFALLVASPVVLLLADAAGFPAADDVTHVAFVVALLIALQLFPLAATNRRDRWKTALDALTVLVGGTMVLWYTAFGPYVADHGLSLTVVASALYPIGDLALLFSVARILLRGADASAQRALRPLAAGALILFAGDAVHGYLDGHGQLELHSPWQFVCWITADALLAAAAVEQCRTTGRIREPRQGARSARYLPFAAIAVAHVLVLAAAVQSGSFYPWGGLAAGGAVLTAIVLTRQILVQRESDERSVTDGLTGLANRSRFRAVSHRALARGARSGQYAGVLVIDMNEFKEVNDTLGHKSGDLVLAGFAEVLRDCVPGWGLAARLGGDEFAVVLPDLDFPEEAYEIAGRLAAGIGPVIIEGRLVSLAASIGVAVSGPGELTHDEIVHRADVAMYQAKKLGPQTRWAVWQESLEQPAQPAQPAAA